MRVWTGRYGRSVHGEVDKPKSRLGSADDSDQRLPLQGSSDRGEEGEARNTLDRPSRGHRRTGQ